LCHFGLNESSVRFAGLVQGTSILITGCPDGELIAAGAQAVRFAVLPLHENLKLVGVPDNTDAANAQLALFGQTARARSSPLDFERKAAEAMRPLDLLSLIWDLVVPPHDSDSSIDA
jgi:hypothetical protein